MGELGSPFTPEQQRLRGDALQLARAWAARRVELRRHTLAHGAHHPDFWRDCCDAGVMGVLVPAELGGSEQGCSPRCWWSRRWPRGARRRRFRC